MTVTLVFFLTPYSQLLLRRSPKLTSNSWHSSHRAVPKLKGSHDLLLLLLDLFYRTLPKPFLDRSFPLLRCIEILFGKSLRKPDIYFSVNRYFWLCWTVLHFLRWLSPGLFERRTLVHSEIVRLSCIFKTFSAIFMIISISKPQRVDIMVTLVSLPLHLLQLQIVCSKVRTMAINLHWTFSVHCLKTHLRQFLQHYRISHYRLVPYLDPQTGNLFINQVKPWMLLNLLNLIPFVRIDVKYMFHQISQLSGYSRGKFQICFFDFIVEVMSIGVFKGKVSTDHSKKDDSRAPNINCTSIVFLRLYHLGSCIKRGSTSSFQRFTILICIAESKIYDL